MKRVALSGTAILAVLAIPVAVSAASATSTSTIQSIISSVISITSGPTVEIDVTPTGAGVQTIAADTVSVSTNNSTGYALDLEENTTGANAGKLVSGSNTISAVTGTFASPVAETAESWGYRVDGAGGFGAGPTSPASNAAISGTIKFAKIPANGSPDTLKTTSTTASNDTTSVWYGIAADTAQPSGTYTNVVKYTAITNP